MVLPSNGAHQNETKLKDYFDLATTKIVESWDRNGKKRERVTKKITMAKPMLDFCIDVYSMDRSIEDKYNQIKNYL